jgi:Ca2+-binding EF-hand superfamily protein
MLQVQANTPQPRQPPCAVRVEHLTKVIEVSPMRTASIVVIGVLFACAANAQMRERSGMSLDRADANGDGVIARAEFMNARAEQFASRDRNNDGFIDERNLGRRAAGRERVAQAMSAMRNQLDSDGDGKVAKREFVDGGGKLFDRADADKSGTLDKNEIEAVKASMRDAAGR